MNKFFLLIFSFLGQIVLGQTLTKKQALSIAKTDSIYKIKSVDLVTDSATKTLCWRIEEKVNLKKERQKVVKADKLGTFDFYAHIIKINATTGQVIRREKKFLGSVHIASVF